MLRYRGMRTVAGVVFGYEALALITGNHVTLTTYSARHPWFKYALLVLLGLHLFPPYILAGAKPDVAR